MRNLAAGILTIGLWLMTSVHAAAMEARILEVRLTGPTIRASIELRDVIGEKFRELLQSGEALHVRVEAELWEDRPLWDKLVRPAILNAFKIIRDPNSQISIADSLGIVASLPDSASPVPLRVEVAPADALRDGKYYLRLVATVGTVEPKEAEEATDAVFGRDNSTISVAGVGRLIFSTVVQVADYLQSVSAEVRSRVFEAKDLKAGIKW